MSGAPQATPTVLHRATASAHAAEITIQPHTAFVPVVRRLTQAVCALSRIPDDIAYQAELIVAELTTNAIVHAETPLTVRVLHAKNLSQLQLTVTDEVPGFMEPVTTGDDPVPESGRGIDLVASLADTCGWEPHPPGKRVWATLNTKH